MLQCSETIIKSISLFVSVDPEETRSNLELQLFSRIWVVPRTYL